MTTTTNTHSNYNYINLPDELKTNYTGIFPSESDFTKKVTELWEQTTTTTGYQGKEITYKTYEQGFTDLIRILVTNELNDYKKSKFRRYRREDGLEPTHTPEEIEREQNTLNAYRSLFTWDEEFYVKRDLEVVPTQEIYSVETWQDGITKEQVRDFNEGKISFEEISGETDDDHVANAISEGDLGLEVYDSFNSGAGVRLYKINLRENFLPFPLPLIDSVVAEKVGRNFDEKVKILGEE